MRILKIYDGDYPWDVRVEKTLRTLSGGGHEVTLVARNRQGRSRRERVEGATLHRLPHFGRAESLATFPAFFHPVWIRTAWAAARETRPERILVRDLPLAPLGLWLGKRLGIPVIVDMAEPYPEALRSNWQFDDLGGLDHLLRSPRLAEAVERWVVRRSPRTLVVAAEAGERLERCGLPPGRWTLVHNTPELSRVKRAEATTPRALEGWEQRKILIFAGILVGDRGVEVAVEGMSKLLRTRGESTGLVVIGDGPARARYMARARELGVESAVRFPGWVEHGEIPAYLARAHVGLLPFHACTHIHTTLANKLFDYMALGLPVLASDARPMVRVLAETGAGLTFRAGDPDDFARVAARMLDDPAAARTFGVCGREAAESTYCWERDAKRLLEAVEHP